MDWQLGFQGNKPSALCMRTQALGLLILNLFFKKESGDASAQVRERKSVSTAHSSCRTAKEPDAPLSARFLPGQGGHLGLCLAVCCPVPGCAET